MTEELDVPEAFYKYRSLQTLDQQCFVEAMVLRGEIYFAAPATFNDPFELRPMLSLEATEEDRLRYFRSFAKKHRPNHPEDEVEGFAKETLNSVYSPIIADKFRKLMEDRIIEKFSTVGLFCVSRCNDDLLMWAHYANEHKGVCLVFDGLHDEMAEAQKVRYETLRTPSNPIIDSDEVLASKGFLTKSIQWKYEEEWRLIDHINGSGVKKFPPRVITGVIIGARAPDPVVATVRSWTKRREDPLKIFRARISESEFKLIIEPDENP